VKLEDTKEATRVRFTIDTGPFPLVGETTVEVPKEK